MKSQSIKWEISEQCNLQCKHCFLGDTKYTCDLTINDYKKIIFKLKSHGFKYAYLSAKEPFCKPELFEILSIFQSYGISVCINTNGTLITDDMIEKLYFSSSVIRIDLSLEGWCKNDNDYIRGDGVFEKVIRLLETLLEKNETSYRKIIIGLSINLTKLNINKIDEFLKFNSKYDNLIISFSIISLIGNAKNHKNLLISYEEFDLFRKKMILKLNKSDKNLIIFSFSSYYSILYFNLINQTNQEPVLPSCSAYKGEITLLPNGDICRCSEMISNPIYEFDNNVGNALKSSLDCSTPPLSKIRSYKFKEPCCDCIVKEQCQFCPVAEKGYSLDLLLIDCKKYMFQVEEILNDILCFKIKISVSDKVTFIKENNSFIIQRLYIGNKCKKIIVDEKTFFSIKMLKNEFKHFSSINNILEVGEFKKLFYSSVFII